MRRIRILTSQSLTVLPAALLLLLIFEQPAIADTIYTYTGNPFTSAAPNPYGLSTLDYITASFTWEGSSLICPTSCQIPLSIVSMTLVRPDASDVPVLLIVPGWPGAGLAEVQTDASGAITDWAFYGCLIFGCEDKRVHTDNRAGVPVMDWATWNNWYAFNQNDPGVWTMTPAPVPEPTTFLTFGSGLAFLGGLIRKKWL